MDGWIGLSIAGRLIDVVIEINLVRIFKSGNGQEKEMSELSHSHSSGWANSGHKLYLVVDDVLETDALGLVEVVEELLVEDEGDAGDLLDVALRLGVTVYEVDGDGDGQLAPELFPPETLQER